jgi:hypothetical protein
MLSVVVLNVIILSVIILNVEAPLNGDTKRETLSNIFTTITTYLYIYLLCFGQLINVLIMNWYCMDGAGDTPI